MKIGRILAVLAIVALASCSSGDGGPKMALLEVSFEPNPVVRSEEGHWHYQVVLEEKRGTGVVITSFAIARYAPNGDFLVEWVYDPAKFAEWFNDCGGVDNYVPGDGRRCAWMYTTGTSGALDWTFYGNDDLGNVVTSTGRLTLR